MKKILALLLVLMLLPAACLADTNEKTNLSVTVTVSGVKETGSGAQQTGEEMRLSPVLRYGCVDNVSMDGIIFMSVGQYVEKPIFGEIMTAELTGTLDYKVEVADPGVEVSSYASLYRAGTLEQLPMEQPVSGNYYLVIDISAKKGDSYSYSVAFLRLTVK